MKRLNLLLTFLFASSLTAFAQSWDTSTPFIGNPIDDGIGFSIGNNGFVGSGRDAGFQYKSEFYKFENNSWEQIANNKGAPRQYATSFSFPNTGCIVTGLAPQDSLLKENQCYSAANDEWSIMTPFPGAERLQASSFTIGNYGFCGGGRNLQIDFGDWFKFDIENNYWQQISSFPSPRNECIAFTINGIGYVGLGRNMLGDFFNDLYAYNPLTDDWTEIAEFPGNISNYSSAFTLNNKAFVCTGSDNNYDLSSEVWSYSPQDDKWTQLADFPFPKIKGVSQFTINECAYLVTGIDEQSVRQDVNYSYCESFQNNEEFLIYPNPTTDQFVISSLTNQKITSLEIINLTGQTVYFMEPNSTLLNIDVSQLNASVYILRIINIEQSVAIHKLIKH